MLYVVYKQSSTTTKVRAVFDTSATSGTGVSLIIPCKLGLLATFPCLTFSFSSAATELQSQPMFRRCTVLWQRRSEGRTLLNESLVWQLLASPQHGSQTECHGAWSPVSTSCNGADSIELATHTWEELQGLLERGHFMFHKWNLSSPSVLKIVPSDLRDTKEVYAFRALILKWLPH